LTKDQSYLQDAIKTANAANLRLTSPQTGVLPSEGTGDGGLFKGILVRYLMELIVEDTSQKGLIDMLLSNAKSLWQHGQAEDKVLFSNSWINNPDDAVELSVQLSGVILLDQMAKLESQGILKK